MSFERQPFILILIRLSDLNLVWSKSASLGILFLGLIMKGIRRTFGRRSIGRRGITENSSSAFFSLVVSSSVALSRNTILSYNVPQLMQSDFLNWMALNLYVHTV